MNVISAAHEMDDAGRRLPTAGHGPRDNRGRRWAALLDRVANGDIHALATLYDESSSLTFGLIMHILQDREAAEDALVDLYTQVRDQACSKTPDRNAMSWLIGLARHTALARLRRSRDSRHFNPLPHLPSASAASVTPFEPFHRERQQIGRALDQLTPRQRSIIQMTYFGGLSAREVADELRLQAHQVMDEIRRAMWTLRNFLSSVDAG